MTAKLTTALSLLAALLCTAAAQSNEVVVEKQITETLHQMYEAEKRRDLPFVLSHLAEDFAEVAGDGGIYHRADIEAGWNDVSLSSYARCRLPELPDGSNRHLQATAPARPPSRNHALDSPK
jgi:hypothetical protein